MARRFPIKPIAYVLGGCVSLYGAARYMPALMNLKENGLGAAAASLTGGSDSAGLMSKVQGALAGKPTDLESLQSMIDGGDGSNPDGAHGATTSKGPVEIVVRDLSAAAGPSLEDRDELSKAVALQNTKQYGEAETIYLGLLDRDPRNTGAHRNLAVLYCQTEQYEQAWTHVRALELLKRPMPEEFVAMLSRWCADPYATAQADRRGGQGVDQP